MKRNLIDASQLELEDKVVSIKRVTKVVKGGRNFRFTALVVVGDGNGHVGAGLGKAAEIPEAIRKGKEDAIKKLVTVARDENGSITHDFVGSYGSASMLLKRAPEGTGVIAGGPARLCFGTAPIGDFTKVTFNVFAILIFLLKPESHQQIFHEVLQLLPEFLTVLSLRWLQEQHSAYFWIPYILYGCF